MCFLFTAEHKAYQVLGVTKCTILRKMLTYFDFNGNNTSRTNWEGDKKKLIKLTVNRSGTCLGIKRAS